MGIDLNARRRRILQAVVDSYIETSEPVGSQWLADRYEFGCRSATLRNDMAEMADYGYLSQPHTSAGRIPTSVGYRFYVDHLMPPMMLESSPTSRTEAALSDIRDDVHGIVKDACRLLMELTSYPAVASAPTGRRTSLHHLILAQADSRHVLLVAIFSTGHTESRIVETADGLTRATLVDLADRLNHHLAQRTLTEIMSLERLPAYALPRQWLNLAERLLAAVRHSAASIADGGYLFEGPELLLRQREFQNTERMEQVLSVLTESEALAEVFLQFECVHVDPVGAADTVRVVIGDEHRTGALDHCSLVARRYNAGLSSWGYIGVVGPTRMQYSTAMSAVEMTARALSAVLARTSLAG